LETPQFKSGASHFSGVHADIPALTGEYSSIPQKGCMGFMSCGNDKLFFYNLRLLQIGAP
jgi:hypothetical protein